MKKHMDEHGEKGRKIPVNEGGEAPMADEDMGIGPDAGMAEAEVQAAAPDAGPLQAELDKARAEAKELQDKYLRLYAETENFKKRMSRESAEREKYYNEGILKELLPVVDNLERAIAHAGENGGKEGGLVEGVRMVRKQFMDALVKFGVKEVECIGLPFDPASQQAMMQVETPDYDEGTVVEVFQKGYYLNDRILRPAMVTVAKKPAASAGDEPQED